MNLSAFQLILLGMFSVFMLVGVALFSSSSKFSGKTAVGTVVIWGTQDSEVMTALLDALRQNNRAVFDAVSYEQKNPTTYAQELVNAMATGQGPDLFLVSQELVTSFSDKIIPIPFSALSQQSFIDSYIDEARLFLLPQGVQALPLMEDPLVMYWNRDILQSAGAAKPPAHWSDFLDLAPKVTVLDGSANIKTSTVALGGWGNVRFAKDIVSALLLQAGDPIVAREASGNVIPVLGQTPQGAQENPAASALQFYTEFANPSKTTYSWNRALPNSQDAFAAGTLAIYFGRASDYPLIAARNPNLHFGVALLPQIEGSATTMTYGQLTGVAISRTSQNAQGALTVALALTNQSAITTLAGLSPLPSVRRDVSLDTSANAAAAVFNQSALIARGWLDPEPTQTNEVFRTMIESVVSGKNQPPGAVYIANQALQSLLHTNTQQLP